MRKLFLTSAGLPEETRKYFLDFLDKDPRGLKVGFIPTAAYPEVIRDYVEEAKDELKEMGMEIDEVYLEKENEESLYEKLSVCDIVYVNGGNSFYLLDWARKSGFDKIIGKLLDEGKIYVGVSAGSYVACPTIEMSHWKNQDRDVVGLKDLTGLNLVPFLLTAHYTKDFSEAIQEGAKKTNLPIVALTDQQAVAIIDDEIKVVGEGEKLFYNRFREN
ncbi:MAG: Type 1 glutamine amidotransferase-like domain-containing protein [Parcubacteria group bacterium]|jgi:dipeptidase E